MEYIINIDRTVRLAVAGLEVGKMTDGDGDNYKIPLTKEKSNINSLDAFDNLYVNNIQGTVIPFTQVAYYT